MHKYPNVIVVNIRKLKKVLKSMNLCKEQVDLLVKRYKPKMVVCGITKFGYVCVTTNQERITVPHPLTKRIRNNGHLKGL